MAFGFCVGCGRESLRGMVSVFGDPECNAAMGRRRLEMRVAIEARVETRVENATRWCHPR